MCENQQHLSNNLSANPLLDLSQVKGMVILCLGLWNVFESSSFTVCDFSKVELVELRAFFVGTEILVQIFGSVRRFPCSSYWGLTVCWMYTEVVHDAVFSHLLPVVQRLSSLELRKTLSRVLTHSNTMTPFDAPGKQAFWKHCGKRRNCW